VTLRGHQSRGVGHKGCKALARRRINAQGRDLKTGNHGALNVGEALWGVEKDGLGRMGVGG